MSEKSLRANFYRDRVCLNVLVGSHENARACLEEADGHILCGILTKNYATDAAAIEDMCAYRETCDNAISVGLGGGSPLQSAMVTRVAAAVQPQHVNQVFTGVAATRALLGQDETIVNGLVSPTGRVGYVNIATGPLSSVGPTVEVSVEAAVNLLKDMGATSLKFFPMGGTTCLDEYREVARVCARMDFALEPTGGIDLSNFETILRVAVEAGVRHITPHVYSSIIDKKTGETRPDDVRALMRMVKSVLG